VATERAFIMIAVMLGAVLLDRRALTLRSVAVAAIILLLARPESLLEPGFQMSFAATMALIAGLQALDRSIYRDGCRAGRCRSSRWCQFADRRLFDRALCRGAFQPLHRLRAARQPADRAGDGAW
jgi:hypothetical protein